MYTSILARKDLDLETINVPYILVKSMLLKYVKQL